MTCRFRYVLRVGIAVAVLGIPSDDLRAQHVSTSLYLGGGPETNGLSAAVGLRLDVSRTWGAYGRIAIRGVTNACLTSLPPTCNYPDGDAREYALGASREFTSETWRIVAGAGGGVITWQRASDPFLDLSMDARRSLNSRLAVLLGLHAVYMPSVERERRGNDAIVRERSVFFPNALAGLSMRLW